jgi:hypothetical protein
LFYKNLDGKEIPLQQMGKNAVYVGENESKDGKELIVAVV